MGSRILANVKAGFLLLGEIRDSAIVVSETTSWFQQKGNAGTPQVSDLFRQASLSETMDFCEILTRYI